MNNKPTLLPLTAAILLVLASHPASAKDQTPAPQVIYSMNGYTPYIQAKPLVLQGNSLF
jgi:hypothetical protein